MYIQSFPFFFSARASVRLAPSLRRSLRTHARSSPIAGPAGSPAGPPSPLARPASRAYMGNTHSRNLGGVLLGVSSCRARVCAGVGGVFSVGVSCVRATCWSFYVILWRSHVNRNLRIPPSEPCIGQEPVPIRGSYIYKTGYIGIEYA